MAPSPRATPSPSFRCGVKFGPNRERGHRFRGYRRLRGSYLCSPSERSASSRRNSGSSIPLPACRYDFFGKNVLGSGQSGGFDDAPSALECFVHCVDRLKIKLHALRDVSANWHDASTTRTPTSSKKKQKNPGFVSRGSGVCNGGHPRCSAKSRDGGSVRRCRGASFNELVCAPCTLSAEHHRGDANVLDRVDAGRAGADFRAEGDRLARHCQVDVGVQHVDRKPQTRQREPSVVRATDQYVKPGSHVAPLNALVP